jgi:hypothetical protein
MQTTGRHQAARQVNELARARGWPLIADPHLRFRTAQIETALSVWQTQRRARTMPARADLTLCDLKSAVANLCFLDIVRDDARTRFKVRLAGSALDHFLGGTPTGRFIDEAVPHEFAAKWGALWSIAIDNRAPIRTVGRIEFPNRHYYMGEALYAPLASDGESPDMVMTVVYFHARNGAGDDLAAQLARELDESAPLAAI